MSYEYLCESCCYPILHKDSHPSYIFRLKFGRLLFAPDFKDPLLDILPLQDFLGFKSYTFDPKLNAKLKNTSSKLGTLSVGYTTFSFRSILEEIDYSPRTNNNEWRQFIIDYYKIAAEEEAKKQKAEAV